MASMIETKKDTLLEVLDDAQVVLWRPGSVANMTEFKTINNFTELPVIEESIEVDMGSVDAAYTKLTDGTIVAGKFTKGDPSCSFNVASINSKIAELLGNRLSSTAAQVDIDGDTESPCNLHSYSTGMKPKHGVIVIANGDFSHMVVFPNAALSASFNPVGGGDANTGYWAVSFIPMAATGDEVNKTDGASFYLG